MRQILFNLAGNAFKFTETGGVLLGVEAAASGPERTTLRFLVSDTGPGVPEAERERIFDVFAQASAEHGARVDSTGLGLAIVRRLATAHGGRAGVEAPAGGGSRFWFEADFAVEAQSPVERPLAGRVVAVVSPNPHRAGGGARSDRNSGRRGADLCRSGRRAGGRHWCCWITRLGASEARRGRMLKTRPRPPVGDPAGAGGPRGHRPLSRRRFRRLSDQAVA